MQSHPLIISGENYMWRVLDWCPPEAWISLSLSAVVSVPRSFSPHCGSRVGSHCSDWETLSAPLKHKHTGIKQQTSQRNSVLVQELQTNRVQISITELMSVSFLNTEPEQHTSGVCVSIIFFIREWEIF